ncbi:MAG: hypothetical protein M1G31_28140 [Pseudanabaena sp. Salubria-1]|nr:hypothetical protein [Pseudanabaena sp. Salubria-1]
MGLKLFSNPFLLNSFRNGARSQITYFQTVQQTFAELDEAHEKVLAHSKDNLGKDSSKFFSGKKRQIIFAIGQRLKDWYFLAKKLKEVKSLISDSQDLLELTFQAMALTNPIFLLFVTIAVVLTLRQFKDEMQHLEIFA